MAGKGKLKALPAMSNNKNTSSFCLDLALAPFEQGAEGRITEGLLDCLCASDTLGPPAFSLWS